MSFKLIKNLLLAVIAFCSIKSVYALPVGNPSEPNVFIEEFACTECCVDPCETSFFSIDAISVIIGYYGDFVYNRHLETVTERQVDYCQISTNAGYFALCFWDLFDIFTTLGATKFTFNSSLGPFNSANPSPRFDFESATAFSWSIGARGILWEYQRATLGMMVQYFSSNPQAKVLFVRANVDAHPDESSKRRYSEYQLGMGFSYRYNDYFIPYAAIKYSRACWDFNDEIFSVTGTLATIPDLRSSKDWGYAIGLTFIPFDCEKLAVTVEGRFADEAALNVNGQMRF